MITRMKHIILILFGMAVAFTSCQTDQFDLPSGDSAPEGYVTLRFNTNIPAMQEVTTRAVDADGMGVQTMTLFCFDEYGLFISTVKAEITGGTNVTEGTFKAIVPDNTRTVHFVANQNMTDFKEDDFRNKSEAQIMAMLESSSGRMIYWARFACAANNTENIVEQMKGHVVRMIRNHAKVTIEDWSTQYLTVTGFTVVNTNAFGTVAPYHPEKGFDMTWDDFTQSDFVTIPKNDAKIDDQTVVNTAEEDFVFESRNSIDDPVSVIVKGHRAGETEAADKWYRVMLVDGQGEQLLIRRNHHYILQIVGELSYGQDSFEKALTAAATNNVWILISDEVKEVEDNSRKLAVDSTYYILPESATGKSFTIPYTLTGKGTTNIAETDKPDVTWLSNNVALNAIGNEFSASGTTGQGTITITPLPLGENNKLEGELLVKCGRLQRKIKVITIKEQSFIPAWMGAQLYGNINDNTSGKRPKATAVFTIPESCPQELFPMRVLVSANDLDIRATSGMKLDVINKGEPGYGEDNEWGYKYVYIAEAPGVQRVYFESILNQAEMTERKVIIEAEHFQPVTLNFRFSEKNRAITMPRLSQYTATDGTGPNDEPIYYRMVPQKKRARVMFYMEMYEMNEAYQPTTRINVGEFDEFLVYQRNLYHYSDDEYAEAGLNSPDEFDCTFYHDKASQWSGEQTYGQVCMFKPKKYDTDPATGTGQYRIYMYTTKAKSAETVRIASNLPSMSPVLPADGSDGTAMDEDGNPIENGKYKGKTYRSTIFELANYNPFRFAAGVDWNNEGIKGVDDATQDATPERVTELAWSYMPGLPVDIEFDVTSFRGIKNISATTDAEKYESVDPFGQEFQIFIDAPMLEIDESRLAACKLNADKLKADPNVPGRFIYTVEANRETERGFGFDNVAKTDETGEVNQDGERKHLPFKVKSAVSAGNITVSSDEEMVVYFAKTFKVTNTPISGSIQYKKGGVDTNVPNRAFVSFELVRNNNRIGSVAVTAEGRYELRLRKEYNFNWQADEVEFRYQIDGVTYSATMGSLDTLFKNPDIVLTPVE